VVDLDKGISRFPPGARVKAVLGQGKVKGKSKSAKKKSKDQPAGGLGGLTSFSSDESGPTNIEAGSLEVHDTEGLAMFRGDVVANRGGQQIKSDRLDVSYVSGAAAAAPAGQDNIRNIVAEGNVVVSAPDDQVVTGDKLVYDARKAIITITGNVTTSQGKNVIKGDKLVINLETGESFFDADPGKAVNGAKTRIKMLINPDDVPRPTN
jgi:lipopolysaccharide export system protein LptA